VEMLPLMKPTAHPQRARPHPVHRLDQAWRSVRGDRHGRLQPTFDQSPQHLPPTRITFPLGGREGQEHLAAIHAEAPNTQDPGLTPPAAPRLIDRIKHQRGNVKPTEGTRPKGCLLMGQALGDIADRTL
jgi:hypothetical protein